MGDKAETIMRTEDIATRKAIWAEATVSVNDTVTFDTVTTITYSAVCKKSDGATIGHSKATNIITITEAGLSNTLVQIFINAVA